MFKSIPKFSFLIWKSKMINIDLLYSKQNFNSIAFSQFSKGEIKVPRSEIKKMLDKSDNFIKKQIRSSGPGGQHVNKTESAVMLRDKKTNITVKVSNSRDSVINSGIAKKRLVDKLDNFYNGDESKEAKKIERIKKQKERAHRKSQAKHQVDKSPENK
jgi:protein subunit release factor B